MATRFRKTIKLAPGVNLNLNKKSASLSLGPKGLKHTISTTGRKTTTIGIPGTGISHTSHTSKKKPDVRGKTTLAPPPSIASNRGGHTSGIDTPVNKRRGCCLGSLVALPLLLLCGAIGKARTRDHIK
jgi:hypothetical protein